MRQAGRNAYRGRKIVAECFCIFLVLWSSLSIYLIVANTRDDPLDHPLFLQTNLFYPAIFFAASRGMGTADISKVPGLDDFIYKRTLYFDTDNIPEDLEVVPLDTVLEVTHLYLFYCMGWLWRLFGVSAWVGALYAGLMRAVCGCALYGMFRLLLGRGASIAGALLVCSAPFMVSRAIEIRDFGKAPFVLGFLFVAAWLLKQKYSSKVFLLIAGLLGSFLGFGLGFRQDVLTCLPPALILLLVLAKPVVTRQALVRAASLVVFVALFFITALPVIKGITLEGGQASAHAFFHGISPESEGRLDFGGASYDSLISVDPAAFAIVNVYARRSGNRDSMINKGSAEYRRAQGDLNAPLLRDPYIYFTGAEYGRQANKVIAKILKMFPADIVSRAWRSVFSIHEIPLQMCDDMRNSADNLPAWLRFLLAFHHLLSSHLARFGLIYIAAVLITVSLRNFWHAVWLFAFFAWFAGYPTLWYEMRHLFFLGFIPIWAMVVCVAGGTRVLWIWRNAEHRSHFKKRYLAGGAWKSPVRNAIGFGILVLSAVIVPITGLRFWQTQQVRRLAEHLAEATLVEVPVDRHINEGRFFLSPAETLPGLSRSKDLPPGETAWEYVAVTVNTRGEDILATIHYDDASLIYNFTQDICIRGIDDGKEGKVTLFFPVYEVDMNYGGDLMAREIMKAYPDVKYVIQDTRPIAEQQWWKRGKFRGISFPEKNAASFQKFFRVQNINVLDLLPIFQLPEDPLYLRFHKTGPWERWIRSLPPLIPDYRPVRVTKD